jgi:apolipoprotein N-acyltransferase
MLKIILPVSAGFLLVASFPRIGQGWLGWAALIPLILFIDQAKNRRVAFWGGFLACAIEFFILMRWIPGVLARYGGLSPALTWFAYVLLVCVLACYPAISCALTKHWILRCGRGLLLLFPLVWVLMEYVQTFTPLGGFPWLCIGYTQSNYLPIMQIAEITGIYGISLLLLSFNTAVAWLIVKRRRRPLDYLPLMAATLLIVVCALFGQMKLGRWQMLKPGFHAAMLQGNISIEDPASVLADKFQDGYVRMAEKLEPNNPDLLILPESPVSVFYQESYSYRRAVEQLAGRYPLGLILSNVNYQKNDNSSIYFNSAFFFNRDGSLAGIYDKIHLVPFGEYIPLKKFFFIAETITQDVGGFSPGVNYRTINVGKHPANAIICFEVIFPQLVRRFVNIGSQLIINLANDGWYGISDAPYQHLEIARLRAIENRRYLLRATNSGISAIIEPTGRIQTSTGLMKEDVCRGKFDFIKETTFYTRYGDVFVFLCAIILICLIFKAEYSRYKSHAEAGNVKSEPQ